VVFEHIKSSPVSARAPPPPLPPPPPLSLPPIKISQSENNQVNLGLSLGQVPLLVHTNAGISTPSSVDEAILHMKAEECGSV